MTTQVWPAAGVPVRPLNGSYQEQLRSFNAEFQPDVGPPNRWPRSSRAMMEVQFRLSLTPGQRQTLLDFYVTTCKSGSLPFTLEDPASGVSYTWFWQAEPGLSASGALKGARSLFNAQIKIRRLI